MSGERAVQQQYQATDPVTSAWVAANAGSGKTHVLVDRIARLLLSGSAPERLLCLTFTRAAAAEMSTRLFKRLGEWTLISDETLAADIQNLTGDAPDSAVLLRARRLFAQALESPGGLRIQTIHAFCERLLKRFPLEAGVVPQFSVLDDRQTEALLEAAKQTVLHHAAQKDAKLADSLAAMTEFAGEERFEQMMRHVAGERGWVSAFFDVARGIDDKVWRAVGLEPGASERSIVANAFDAFDPADLRRVAVALRRGTEKDQTRSAAFAAFATARTREGFEDVCKELLTKDGEIRASLATKGALAFDPSIGDVLSRWANVAFGVRGQLDAHFVAQASAHLLRVSEAMLRAYREVKERRAMLDYDDLIARTVRLFESPGAQWILYKLDGGIDHVLVDEAQDTSPAQWKIITPIAAEFFAGLGAERRTQAAQRTVFAVGDIKQSIMSFQGARPASFVETRTVISEQAYGARATFERVELTRSFRSAPRILELVDAVFADPEAADGVMIDEVATRHQAVRKDIAGFVELWPTLKTPEVKEADAWDAPRDRISQQHPTVTLAASIAESIGRWLQGDEAVFDKQARSLRPMTAGDIMVLVRRRGILAEEIIRQLKRRGIPVAGADRLKLAEHIAVMDLIALGRFALMPRDDLTLATVLKSPLCGIDETALFDLAHGRTQSLWAELRQRSGEPRYASAFAFLDKVWDQADQLPPYEFYASVLTEHAGWKKILARLGLDAADPVEEFLNAALDYERTNTPSLEGFLHSVEHAETEIKRDQDRGEGSVRVMTVHAAKGLEAPVVVLPDTCTTPAHGRHDKELLQAGDTPLWKVQPARDDAVRGAARQAGKEERMREYRRLLYVALTRARDRIYICGYENLRGAEKGCWYELVSAAMRRLDAPERVDGDGNVVRRLGEPAQSSTALGDASAVAQPHAIPAWAQTPAREEPVLRQVSPSAAEASKAKVLRLRTGDGAQALERGRAIHRILEHLASAPPESWGAIAQRIAADDLAHAVLAQSAVAEALRVRRDLLFSHLFAAGSYGEVPLRGVVEWQGRQVELAARLDRVVVGERDVLIVEFKTDRVAPRQEAGVPQPYVTQLALYRAAVARLFEGRAVNCGILWTAEPRLMLISSKLLDGAGAQLDPLPGGS